MEAKKTYSADTERFRPLFLETGLIVTLLAILWVFILKTFEKPASNIYSVSKPAPDVEIIPITRPEPPPPPPVKPSSTELLIVNNQGDINEDFSLNVEATQETEVKPVEYHFATPAPAAEPEVEDDKIFVIVEEKPRFPGGEEARLRYLNENLHYPALAKEAGIQGTVYVTFVVEKDGSISKVEILRGIGGDCDQEALRVVRGMPNWISGKQRGVPVRVAFNMPIRFVLQ